MKKDMDKNRFKNKDKKKSLNEKSSRRKKKPFLFGIFDGFFGKFLLVILVFIIISNISQLAIEKKQEDLPSIQNVVQSINVGEVESILVSGLNVDIKYLSKEEPVRIRKDNIASFDETLINLGVNVEAFSQIDYKIERETGFGVVLRNILPFIFPLLILLVFIWFLTRQTKGGMQVFNFGRSKALYIDPNDKKQRVTFKDVAGDDEAKQELQEFVDFLKKPERFLSIGAKVPKGVLLSGAPGTGKTLLARAVAGEASVPFFSISGSEFVEMFVGVGASRVRDLFSGAKKMSPAIIFIDEIDAVGRTRGSGLGGGNDEREQALNQILVEMDGFSQNDKVIVIASTNRPDILDPALLRPGRFDRKVIMVLPDIKARKEILQVHSKNKKLDSNVNLEVIARRTPGLSGADLAAIINEAGILAVRKDRDIIIQSDLLDSIEKVLYGPERKSRIITEREKKIIAYHEAGHAIVASVLPYADPVQKITIVGRGMAGGYVMSMPDEDKNLISKKELQDDIAVFLGGYVVEKLFFNDITTGPSNDLEKVTEIAESMVKRFGMSNSIPPMSLVSKTGPYKSDVEYSQQKKSLIDQEIQKIVSDGYKTAEKIIKKYKKALDVLVQKLFEVETLEREEFEEFLRENGVPIENRYAK